MIRVKAVLCKDLVVRGEDGAKRKGIDVGVLLCSSNDSVEDRDIYTLNLEKKGIHAALESLPSLVRLG